MTAMYKIVIIADNIRSTHNIGSILRTADAFGVERVIVSGYTPYPRLPHDSRLPHIIDKNSRDIAKTALGAELTMAITYSDDVLVTIRSLAKDGFMVVGLEQDPLSVDMSTYLPDCDIALLIGEERHGLTDELRSLCSQLLEIPMLGKKESLNVSVATAVCLYQLRYG